MSSLFDCGFMPLQKQLDIGLQYYGSKNAITPWLFNEFAKYQPNARYFFDLFGGGGSVSFAGVASGLKVYYNELKTDMPIMFSYVLDCIKSPRSEIGIFDSELYRFCDRESWQKIRDSYNAKENLTPLDLIRRYIYSFNCAGIQYLCSENKAKFKKALHNMVIAPYFDIDYKAEIRVFLDYFCGELGNDERILENILLDFCENPKLRARNIWDRRKDSTRAIISLEAICIAQILHLFKGLDFVAIRDYNKRDICYMIDRYAPHLAKKQYQSANGKYDGGLSECRALQNCQQLDRLQRLEQLQQLDRLQRLERLQQLDRLERLERLERLQQLERLERLERLECDLMQNPLTITNKSYADFDFAKIQRDLGCDKSEILIYCDIPYKGVCVDGYYKSTKTRNTFNYDAFCEWARNTARQGFNVFLSEFETPCPALFKEIASIKKCFSLGKGKGKQRNFVLEKLFLARGL